MERHREGIGLCCSGQRKDHRADEEERQKRKVQRTQQSSMIWRNICFHPGPKTGNVQLSEEMKGEGEQVLLSPGCSD